MLDYLDVVMVVELFETIFVHLNGGHVLVLLHVDVGNVQPDVGEIRRRFADLELNATTLHIQYKLRES